MRRRLALLSTLLAVAGGAFLVAPDDWAASAPAALPQAFPGGPFYTIGCRFSHRNNDDPIAFPGQPGRSHSHSYFGNRIVNASTTPASLRGNPTSCADLGDASAYWAPTLLVRGKPVEPILGLAYYVKRTFDPISVLPAGLKMIAGNQDARRAQPTSIVGFGCGSVGVSRLYATVPACAARQALVLRVTFPNCWNGKTTDSADHKRHMAYATRGRCPESHPVAVPSVMLAILYPSVPRSAQLSSGRFGLHADFMNGWDQDTLAGQVAALNRGRRPEL